MTVTVGRRSLTLGWPVVVTLIMAIVAGSVKGTLFVNEIIDTQKDIQRQLQTIAHNDTVYYRRIDENTNDINSIKPQLVNTSSRLNGLEDILSSRQKIKYYNQIKTKNGIEMVPVP